MNKPEERSSRASEEQKPNLDRRVEWDKES
jgi:hypothetical protein